MAEVLRQGRKNPLLIHEGPEPEPAEDTTPIVGMAVDVGRALIIVNAVNGALPIPVEKRTNTFRTGNRYGGTVYQEFASGHGTFWAWFPDPVWAARVVAALNGDTDG